MEDDEERGDEQREHDWNALNFSILRPHCPLPSTLSPLPPFQTYHAIKCKGKSTRNLME
jgi:hypothetical protein